LRAGGRAGGVNLPVPLMLPVSNDTLLRVVRRRGSHMPAPPTVIGAVAYALATTRAIRVAIRSLDLV